MNEQISNQVLIDIILAKYELQRSDIITYSAMIKSAKLPPIVRNKHVSGKCFLPNAFAASKQGF